MSNDILLKHFLGNEQYNQLNPLIVNKDINNIFGLSENASVLEAIKILSRFQQNLGEEYLWEKYQWSVISDIGLTKSSEIYFMTGENYPMKINYSDNYTIENGILTLNNPSYTTFTSSTDYKAFVPLRGKYAILYKNATQVQTSTINGLVYVGLDATFSGAHNNGWWITCSNFSRATKISKQIKKINTEFLNSSKENTFPKQKSGEYEYSFFGKIGDYTKTQTGTYIGTGNGVSCSLTFNSEPRLVIVYRPEWYKLDSFRCLIIQKENESSLMYIEGNNVIWRTNSESASQIFNENGITYSYVAFM